MKNIFLLALVSLLLLGSISLQGQDLHFTQSYNMPVWLNPANTGNFSGSYRVRAIYRNQWASITDAGVYSTPGFSFDMNFSPKKSKNSFAGGLTFISDRTGQNDFTNTFTSLSGAYHLSLNKKGTQFLSFGANFGYVTKRLNTDNLIFGDQFDTQGNPTQLSQEDLNVENLNNFDIGAGIVFGAYPSKTVNYRIGLAYNHFIQPDEAILSTVTSKLPARIVAHGDLFIKTKSKFTIEPNLLFMTQAGTFDAVLGSNFGYQLNTDSGILLGAGYRVGDAAIGVVGFTYKTIDIVFSYDINVSQLSAATNYNGAYEISFGWIGAFSKDVEPILPAIRFF